VTNIGEGRLLRVCDLCGGVDDHPRHVVLGGPGPVVVVDPPTEAIVAAVVAAAPPDDVARLLRELYDTTASDRHLDCCRAAGCPDGTCNTQIAGADGKTGADLLQHLMTLAEEV
jgi:hypothetical protein